MNIRPDLQQMLDEIKADNAKMVNDMFTSGQVQLLENHGYATEAEALAALPPCSMFQASRNIAGRWTHV
jgi:hypothetical protein